MLMLCLSKHQSMYISHVWVRYDTYFIIFSCHRYLNYDLHKLPCLKTCAFMYYHHAFWHVIHLVIIHMSSFMFSESYMLHRQTVPCHFIAMLFHAIHHASRQTIQVTSTCFMTDFYISIFGTFLP